MQIVNSRRIVPGQGLGWLVDYEIGIGWQLNAILRQHCAELICDCGRISRIQRKVLMPRALLVFEPYPVASPGVHTNRNEYY
jgi:hypothetical protein